MTPTSTPKPMTDTVDEVRIQARAAGRRADEAHRPVALITGASRGLGRELARALAKDGWRLVLTARGAAELSALTEVAALAGSVVDDDHRADLAEAASEFGGADLLVNNASTLTGYDLKGAALPT